MNTYSTIEDPMSDEEKAKPNRPWTLWALAVLVGGLVLLYGYAYSSLSARGRAVAESWMHVKSTHAGHATALPGLLRDLAAVEEIDSVSLDRAKAAIEGAPASDEFPETVTGLRAFLAQREPLDRAVLRLVGEHRSSPKVADHAAFRKMESHLSGRTLRVRVAHTEYNQKVREYNDQLQAVPERYFSRLLGFPPKTLLPVP